MTSAEWQALTHQLILHEGLRLKPYLDTVGKWTIGVGRNLTDVGISDAEASLLLEHDLHRCLEDCETFLWFHSLDPIRQRVIVDMRFNLGAAGLRKFTNTLAAVARGDYDAAATGMMKSLWARQVKRRAVRLAEMMRTGVDA